MCENCSFSDTEFRHARKASVSFGDWIGEYRPLAAKGKLWRLRRIALFPWARFVLGCDFSSIFSKLTMHCMEFGGLACRTFSYQRLAYPA